MIVSWTMTTIEPGVESTISYYDDAKLISEDLREQLCVANVLGISSTSIKSELIQLIKVYAARRLSTADQS